MPDMPLLIYQKRNLKTWKKSGGNLSIFYFMELLKGVNHSMEKNENASSVLGEMSPSKAIVKLAVPATLALQYGCRGCFSCNNHFPVPYLWHFHLVLCQRTLHYQNQTQVLPPQLETG